MVIMGYITLILSFIGIILNARRKRSSWIVWILSNVVWLIYAVNPVQWPLILMQICLLGGNIYGLIKWKK